jgi:ferredoxin-NADP reductase
MASRQGTFPLVVSRIVPESTDILSIELVHPAGEALPEWGPGAHLDVQLVTRHQRQYSLCGDPSDRYSYRIAVLREEFSRGASMYIHTYLREGRTVHAKPPRNLFPVLPADEYLLLAAGIGITPILPMAFELRQVDAAFSMHFAVQDAAHLPFKNEIAQLGDRVIINSREHAGRLDLDAVLADPRTGLAVYSCGPTRFTNAVESAMAHWPAGSLHLERFEPKPIVARPNEPFTVRAARSGIDVEVQADTTMLKALDAAGVAVPPSSCLRGVCGSCALRIIDGVPEHRDSLTTDPESSTIYPCVSRSLVPLLIVDT